MKDIFEEKKIKKKMSIWGEKSLVYDKEIIIKDFSIFQFFSYKI